MRAASIQLACVDLGLSINRTASSINEFSVNELTRGIRMFEVLKNYEKKQQQKTEKKLFICIQYSDLTGMNVHRVTLEKVAKR